MRAYLDGKEIDQLPELREICALPGDDWFPALIKWLVKNRPGIQIQIIVGLEATSLDEGRVLEMWVPEAPAMRAAEIGGILKTLTHKKDLVT